MRSATSVLGAIIAVLSMAAWASAMQHFHVVVKTVIHTVYIPKTDRDASISQYSRSAVTPSIYPVSSTAMPTVVLEIAPDPAYMAVVRRWRTKMNLKPLAYDRVLESNAMDTVKTSNGVMSHKLNPGTFGQVLAPDEGNDFEHVFVGGWLCEMPALPGLDAVCAEQSVGWAYNDQTGHAEILTSDGYSRIGCALHAGIRCCDLA